ncbi:hypothetical protein MAR_004551 [Mya arenaria]|uniref:Uncharacterized protein n=1 Tax=Mya arenaria TaxID=6604 RepID=A0ABY7F044_MYAAR|nr:hypothetical protein MAR_004551 [Mya arenaria]
MENVVGYPKKERDEIISYIFGQDGLLVPTDIDTQRCRRQEMHQLLRNKLLRLLYTHIIEPVIKGKITPTWTNNNCESANHVLKSAIQWKMQDLPQLIETLLGIVKGEQEE